MVWFLYEALNGISLFTFVASARRCRGATQSLVVKSITNSD